jgi:hypothetical protein|tara:strand:- start:90 stop:251 length:162 start_codon:yes stop_codon:yes gene_type:complete
VRWQKITAFIRRKAMPNVKGKKFPYTKKGMTAAKKAAKKKPAGRMGGRSLRRV